MKKSLFVLAVAMMIVPVASAAVTYSAGPGTGAPTGVLGGYAMTSFPLDPQGVFADVTSVASPLGGSLGFSTSMSHRRIGQGWASWSHGYTGDVYFTNGATAITMTMPAGTGAFEFYVEPDPFSFQTFEAIAGGTSSGVFQAHGQSGAAYVGFYTDGAPITSIALTGSVQFSVGEFAVAAVPEPASFALLALGGLAIIRRR